MYVKLWTIKKEQMYDTNYEINTDGECELVHSLIDDNPLENKLQDIRIFIDSWLATPESFAAYTDKLIEYGVTNMIFKVSPQSHAYVSICNLLYERFNQLSKNGIQVDLQRLEDINPNNLDATQHHESKHGFGLGFPQGYFELKITFNQGNGVSFPYGHFIYTNAHQLILEDYLRVALSPEQISIGDYFAALHRINVEKNTLEEFEIPAIEEILNNKDYTLLNEAFSDLLLIENPITRENISALLTYQKQNNLIDWMSLDSSELLKVLNHLNARLNLLNEYEEYTRQLFKKSMI